HAPETRNEHEEALDETAPATRHGKIRLGALAVAAAALLVPAGQAAAANASAGTATAPGARPSIVLVHGAWADSSSWDAVAGQLQHDGYTVYVPPNPLLGLSYDPAFLRDFLNTIQ